MAQKTQNASNAEDQSAAATPAAQDTSDSTHPQNAATTTSNSGSSTQQQPNFTELDAALRSTSQPMTKSASSGSDPTPKDAAAETASPYGTRSRNRAGTSRPNYAEDKDLDTEMYDYAPDKKEPDSKKPTRQSLSNVAAAPTPDGSRLNGSSRKPSTTTDESKPSPAQTAPKEAQPAGPVPTTQPTQSSNGAQPSKKRKAASQSTSGNTQAQTPISQSSTNGGSSRKATQNSQNPSLYSDTNMLSFENCNARPKNGSLVADDGTVLRPNDNVYLVCEPPGEPYYLGRIMEFLHTKNDSTKPIDALRINWFYRPKDIGKKVNDTRLVFATMHSDISPLTALRGKCRISHKAEIPSMDEYRKTPDCFWYEKLYDRYIQKNYDLIPTSQIVNVPEKVKKVLDERWKFIIVEQGRGKEFTSAVKLCKRCSGYCASNDSVDCAVCKNTYHMNCVRPPLLKKPSRGFAWSCAACSRAQERKLEARHTPNMLDPHGDDEDEFLDDEEEDPLGLDTGRTSPADDADDSHRTGTAEQIHQASLWPWRYLGLHCKVEDALDYDDRIYPRASTRIGPRHQAMVLPWPGQPVEYVKPLEVKKAGKKESKLSKEAHAALEAEKARREKRPKWVQDEPPGYVARGEDCDSDDPSCTAMVLWKPPQSTEDNPDWDAKTMNYMGKAGKMAAKFGLSPESTNMQDVAIETYFHSGYSEDRALKLFSETDKAAFKEPELTPAEQKRFEEGVSKYGSELHSVMKHVKTVPPGTIVRYYYVWKKTKQGQQIWGNYHNRKGKKEAKKAEAAASKLQDDVADDADDSAFDAEKANDKKKGFICKFCSTKTSRQWRRAPNASSALVNESGGKNATKDKGGQYVVALCRRCAELWRRYAIQWEDLEEVAKKVAQAGGRAWKRRQDEELLKELISANDMITIYSTPEPTNPPNASASVGNGQQSGEPPRKKLKGIPDRDSEPAVSDSGVVQSKKKEKAEKPAAPPVPEIPKPKTMPCAVCDQLEPLGDQHLSCRECRLTVHRNCYGVTDNRNAGKWTCDMCSNDKSPQVSIQYKCVLCPVEHTEHDFVEPPKISTSKKKSEKEKEKERVEREQAQKAADFYRKKQEEMNRPVSPHEPLKRTADNNWVHVTCAVWTPEVKFGKAKALAPSEGIPSISRGRYDEVCKACGHKGGACVACHHCRAPVHVECARQQGYLLGFDITPVKGSRRDQFNIVTINGESGAMSATIWCKEHVPTKTIVHRMHDVVNDSGLNALQLYVQSCKQADLTLTGTVRKANLMTTAAKMSGTPVNPGLRRASTTTFPVNGVSAQRQGEQHEPTAVHHSGEKVCITCGIDVSPKWWPIDNSDERELTNGHYGTLGAEAQKFVEQRKFQCHKCRKAKRKPNPHPPKDPSPVAEAVRPTPAPVPVPVSVIVPPLVATPLRSPPATVAEPRPRSLSSYAWVAPAPPVAQQPPQPPAPAPVVVAAPPPQIPVAPVPPPPIPQPAAHHSPAGPPLSYPPPNARYNDWPSRPPTHHGSPPRQINGGPPQMQTNSMANLSALRPPPMSIPPPPPMNTVAHNGHFGQPMHNGLPPSPRRMDGHPAMPNTSPYMHPYHHSHHPPPHPHNNGGMPPRGPDGFSQGLMPQRTPFSTPHGSPPVSRDGHMSRDPPGPLSAPAPRPAGASTSPSLRNLLS